MIYLISVVLKDFHFRIPWADLEKAAADQLALDDIFTENLGIFQCRYIFPSEAEVDYIRQQLQEAICQLVPDLAGKDVPPFAVTVRPFSSADCEKLKPETVAVLSKKTWFSAAPIEWPAPAGAAPEAPSETPSRTIPAQSASAQSAPTRSTPAQSAPAKSAPTPSAPARSAPTQSAPTQSAPAQSAPVKSAPVREQPAAAEAPEEEPQSMSLPEITQELSSCRKHLLSIVRGQRHAIDELTQGMFECNMFSNLMPDRERPNATFLFMGPSGVGKTFLAKQFARASGRPSRVFNMSEFSDNLANLKFNGDHGQPNMVTGFVKKNPNAILIFDEIEKAHINTIFLFLQILDSGTLMDHQLHKDVSFRDTTIIMTTNVGRDLYENSSARNLSNIPRNALLDALRKEKSPNDLTQGPAFPSSITTRMANGHIIMFNHLEPYTLLTIVRDEIRLYLDLFHKSTGITVEFDEVDFPAMVMYAGGAAADARTLRGLARNIVVKEILEATTRLFAEPGRDPSALKRIVLTIDTPSSEPEIYKLFHQTEGMQAVVFSPDENVLGPVSVPYLDLHFTGDPAAMQKKARGIVDFVLLDPYAGYVAGDRLPSDIEDIDSDGMQMFDYLVEYFPEIPIYLIDTGKYGEVDFSTLLSRGARGILPVKDGRTEIERLLQEFSLNALIGNTVYRLGRSGKFLSYNCAQYPLGEDALEICFSNLSLKTAVSGEDYGSIAKKGENSGVTFDDIVGCKTAKEALMEFCKLLDDPRKGLLEGRRMPKGVLLYGPPGTGKTMLAKAMANHSNAMFLPTSATAFFGSLVGQTEGSIRELFKKARRYAPSVIFIDEVDAIARRRTGSISTSHNEDALNTLLSEMDGFVVDEKRPVFILAATNYELDGDGNRVLDPAFVRRFDRKIRVDLPDTESRRELFRRTLEKHNIHFGEAHDAALQNMAERSGGMCNADIEMVVEMYVRTVSDGTPTVSGFMDALDEYRFGDVKKYSEDSLRQTAYHEGGHALVSWVCGVKPLFMTIIARNNYGGYLETSNEDKGTFTFHELKDVICRCLAGRAAELVVFGDVAGINTGASSDIKKARYLVRSCLSDYGMGETLYRRFTSDQGEALMQEQFERAKSIIARNREALDRLVELLMEKKCLNKEEIDAFFSAHARMEPAAGEPDAHA